MRTQSIDTHPEAERVMVELIRRAPISKRFRLVQSLTQSALWPNFYAWRERHREASMQEAAVQVVSICYGPSLARCVHKALERRKSWQMEPTDLMAAMLPAVRAFDPWACPPISPARLLARCTGCSSSRGMSTWSWTCPHPPLLRC